MMNKILAHARRHVPPAALGIAVLLLWEVGVRAFDIPEYVLPRPTAILVYCVRNFSGFLDHFWVTAVESTLGLALGIAVGVALAVVSVMSEATARAILPWAITAKTVPIVAIAPLLILWFGYGLMSKVVMAAAICFFPIFVTTLKGFHSFSEDAWYLFRSYGATKWQLLTKLQVPHCLPYFFASLRVGATLAVIGAIVAELAGAKKGLGFLVLYTSMRVDTLQLFGAILFSSVLGFLLYGLVAGLDKLVVARMGMETLRE
jgi:ABC-type nitrate/sulfonate/bicarbonate transport system permease component